MLSEQRGFLHLAESFRCHGFCMMSEGSAITAFLKGNMCEIQCRPLLKLSQPYFPRFRWPLDSGSPSPTWQSYIMSDFFLHHDCFFPWSCYRVPIHNVLNTAKGINTPSIYMAPWPWTSRHRDCLGLQPLLHFLLRQGCRVLLMGDMNQATKEGISWFGWVGELEKTLILFLGVLEKYWPA